MTMTYTICISLPNSYYTMNRLSKEDVEFVASAFEERLDDFFFGGKKYDIKDITEFRIFAYDNPDDFHTKINASKEALDEGYFSGKFVYFKPYTLGKLFPEVTNEFIRKFDI